MTFRKYLAFAIIGIFTIGLFNTIVFGQEVTGSSESQNVHMNMKTSNGLSPVIPGEGQTQSVQANHDQIGILLINRDWTDIGTWTSDQIASIMDVSGNADFNLWCALTEGRSQNDCMFRFTIKQNDNVIGTVEIQDQTVNEEPTEILATIGINATTFQPNDQISIYLEYNGWDDMDVYYDNMTHDSGVTISCNPLTIYGVSASKEEVSLEFADAFDFDWTTNTQFTSVRVGGESLDMEPTIEEGQERETSNGTVTTKLLVWELDKDYEKGTSVSVSISYAGNISWDTTGEIGKGAEGDPIGDEDDNNNIIIGGIAGVVIVVAVVGIIVIRKRRM